jgi:hypothetical protein
MLNQRIPKAVKLCTVCVKINPQREDNQYFHSALSRDGGEQMIHEGFTLEWIMAERKQFLELIHDQYKPRTFGQYLRDSSKVTERITLQIIPKIGG